MIIGDVLIRCDVCGICIPFQKNRMLSCDYNGGSNINFGVYGILVKTVERQLLFVKYGKGIFILRLFQRRLLGDAD